MAKQTDTIKTRHQAPDFKVPDGMPMQEALDFLSPEERAALETPLPGEKGYEEPTQEAAQDETPTDPGDTADEQETIHAEDSQPSRQPEAEHEGQEVPRAGDDEQGRGDADAEAKEGDEERDGERPAEEPRTGEDRLAQQPETPEAITPEPDYTPRYEPQLADEKELKGKLDQVREAQRNLDDNVEKALSALDKKRTDGEIDVDEYMVRFRETERLRRDAQRRIDDARRDTERALDSARLKAEVSAEYNEQAAKRIWDQEVAKFFADNPRYAKSRALRDALDGRIQFLSEKHAKAPLSNRQYLNLAKQQVEAELGIAEPKTDKDAAIALAKQRGRKPEIPKTLGGVPSAKGHHSKMDDIDNLTGLELEDAIANMTESAWREYSEHR